MPTSEDYSTLSFTKDELEEWRSAMAQANDQEIRPFDSLAEFVRDAVRRRIESMRRRSRMFVPITDRKLQGMNDG